MSPALAAGLIVTDSLFLAYWLISTLAAAGVIHLPPAMMYAGYGDRLVTAWNWSFAPLDLAFSIIGFAALAAARRGHPLWRPLALMSLLLTAVAGLMAVAYWTLLQDFDPAWFLPNLALLIWPLIFIPRIVRELS
jgi:hypothetical protein